MKLSEKARIIARPFARLPLRRNRRDLSPASVIEALNTARREYNRAASKAHRETVPFVPVTSENALQPRPPWLPPRLPMLRPSDQLAAVASKRAEQMIAQGVIEHTKEGDQAALLELAGLLAPREIPDGCWSRFFYFDSLCEVIAVGFWNTAHVLAGWMQSPEHRATILARRFDQVGSAVTEAVSLPDRGINGPLVVAIFGYERYLVARWNGQRLEIAPKW